MSGEQKDKPSKKVPPIVFKGEALVKTGFQAEYKEMGGAPHVDLKIFLGDGENGGEEGKWYIQIINSETGAVCGTYNDAHCPDPLNPDCE